MRKVRENTQRNGEVERTKKGGMRGSSVAMHVRVYVLETDTVKQA